MHRFCHDHEIKKILESVFSWIINERKRIGYNPPSMKRKRKPVYMSTIKKQTNNIKAYAMANMRTVRKWRKWLKQSQKMQHLLTSMMI